MKIINSIEIEKTPIRGNLSVKYIFSRYAYQIYCGGKYVPAASGNTEEEAWEMFHRLYDHQG